jgi:hypothetical protein
MAARLAGQFEPALTRASRSALLELARSLRHYSEALTLVGGWVPYLLLREHQRADNPFRHVGSIDIDLVVDPGRIGEDEYATVVDLIRHVGWRTVGDSRFSFERSVPCPDGTSRDIRVDFLTLEPGGEGKKHRHRVVQANLPARTMHGAELALTHRGPVRLEGTLPGGAQTEVELLMLDVVGCLGTKGIALGERFKQKDAYDIVSVLDNYGAGVSEVSALTRPFADEELMTSALASVWRGFRSVRSEGPIWYAEFVGGDDEAKERSAQRAFQTVAEFRRLLI